MNSEGLLRGYLVNVNPDDGPGPNLIELRDKELTFGRGAGNSVILASIEVSRRHAILKYISETHQWQLKDTSGNGISLNGVKIPKNNFIGLKEGDKITFCGHLVYRFASVRKPEVGAACSRLETSVFEKAQVDGTAELDDCRSVDDDCVQLLGHVEVPKLRSEDSPPMPKRKKLSGNVGTFPSVPCFSPLVTTTGLAETKKPEKAGSGAATTTDETTAKQLSLYRDRCQQLEREKFELERKYMGGLEDLHDKIKTLESQKAANKEIEVYKKILHLLDEEYACKICTEIYAEATVITCGHTFCSHCIRQWLKQKKECPTCRKPVGEASNHTEMRNFISRFFESLPDALKRNSQ